MSRPITTPLQTLETCLSRQLELARWLLSALQEESRLLEDPSQADKLADGAAAKLACIQQFQALNDTRNQALAQLGQPPDEQGLQQALGQRPAMSDMLAALKHLAAQAANINERNGVIIHTYLRHTQQALADLDQLAGQPRQPLYGASGRPKTAMPAGRTHIKAG